MHDEPGHELEKAIEGQVKEAVQLDTSDDGVYDTHVGRSDYQDQFLTNMTQYRQRGYKIGSLHNNPGDPDLYYKQPGVATSDEHKDYKDTKGYEIWDPSKPSLADTKVRPIRSLDET